MAEAYGGYFIVLYLIICNLIAIQVSGVRIDPSSKTLHFPEEVDENDPVIVFGHPDSELQRVRRNASSLPSESDDHDHHGAGFSFEEATEKPLPTNLKDAISVVCIAFRSLYLKQTYIHFTISFIFHDCQILIYYYIYIINFFKIKLKKSKYLF